MKSLKPEAFPLIYRIILQGTTRGSNLQHYAKNKFSIKDFFSKCDQMLNHFWPVFSFYNP